MGLYDRDYTQADPQSQHFGSSQLAFQPAANHAGGSNGCLIANIGSTSCQVRSSRLAMRSAVDATPLEQIFAVYPSVF